MNNNKKTSHGGVSSVSRVFVQQCFSVYSTIHWINRYTADTAIGFPNTFSLDSDLSDGQRYPTIGQPRPVVRSLDSDNGFDPRDWINTQGLKISEEKLLKLMRTQKHTERTEHDRSVTVRPLDLRVLFFSRCFPKNSPTDIPLGDWLNSVQAPAYLSLGTHILLQLIPLNFNNGRPKNDLNIACKSQLV